MFDVGFSELVLLAIVALVVLGPEKLPHVARVAGAWVGRIRRTVSTMQAEIEREVAAQEFKMRMEKELQKYGATDMVQQLQADTQAMESSLRDVQQSASAAVAVPASHEPAPAMPAVDVVAVADAPLATPAPTQHLLQQTTPLEQVEMDGEKAYREWLQAQKDNRIAPPGLSAAPETATTNIPEDKPAS